MLSFFSSGSSGWVRGGWARNMKSMRPPSMVIFFMTYFYREVGAWPPRLPGSATVFLSLISGFLGHIFKTRMHSSRMRTVRCSDRWGVGVVSQHTLGRGCEYQHALGGGCLPRRGVFARGMSALGGGLPDTPCGQNDRRL